MTELDLLRRIADAARRLLEQIEHDAVHYRLDLAERWPAEVAALRDAIGALEELDQAEAELERLRAKRGRWEPAS